MSELVMKPLARLTKLLNSDEILDLLRDRNKWDSLIVNRRKPYTYRVFAFLPDGYRVCLHKFDPFDVGEAFMHPHPWAGAFAVLEGSYLMKLGHTLTREDTDVLPIAQTVMSKGSMYEILNPLTWHNVTPTVTTYTIMVNRPAWDKEVAHKDVRTTQGKDLDKMPEQELIEHLAKFESLIR